MNSEQSCSKVPFFRSFFDDSGHMLSLEQIKTCHIFHVAFLILYCEIPSSKFEVKMEASWEGTYFY